MWRRYESEEDQTLSEVSSDSGVTVEEHPQRQVAACSSEGEDGKSLDVLTPEEYEWFTRVPQFLEKEVGLSFEGLPAKQCVHVFFQRYLNGRGADYHYYTSTLSTGEVIAHLVTPSFYDRAFQGPSQCDAEQARVAAAELFTMDLQVKRAAELLPPDIETVRRHVTNMLERPGLTASLTRRGVNIKMLTQDSMKAIFQGFQERMDRVMA